MFGPTPPKLRQSRTQTVPTVKGKPESFGHLVAGTDMDAMKGIPIPLAGARGKPKHRQTQSAGVSNEDIMMALVSLMQMMAGGSAQMPGNSSQLPDINGLLANGPIRKGLL